jgi:hypothetical protein
LLTVQVAMKTMSQSTLSSAQELCNVVAQWYPTTPDL